MCLPAIGALLFLAGAIWNLFHGDFENALFGLGIAVVLGIYAGILMRMENATEEFLGFLATNRDKLRAGETLDYNGKPVSINSQVTQFFFCVSLIILTTKIPTRFYIRGYENTLLAGWMSSLFALVFGWWGLPWGPIYTVQSLFINSTGGKVETVGQILPRLEQAMAEEAKKKATAEANNTTTAPIAEAAPKADKAPGPWS